MDAIAACAKLAGRAGATEFNFGYARENVPVDQAGWWAYATWRGTRLMVDERRSPTEAAMALAERLLDGATCRCRRLVTLGADHPLRCRWRLVGDEWQPGCDVPPLRVEGPRGDLGAIRKAMTP